MMTCQDDLVQMYVDGDLGPVEAAIVESHLATCDSCRRRAAFYKGLFWDLAHGERLSPASDLDADALADTLRAEWLKGQKAEPVGVTTLATLWLTANPAVTAPTRAAGRVLAGLGRRLIGWKGGASR